MKKAFLLIAVGLMCIFKIVAKNIDGKIIYDHQIVNVTFNIPVKFITREPKYQLLQHSIEFYDSEGKIKIIKPYEVNEIQFNYQGVEVCMRSVNNIFLRLLIDGNLKLYNFYIEQDNNFIDPNNGLSTNSHTIREILVFQKREGELKYIRDFSFRRDMVKYFRDCPVLAEKIEFREIRKDNLKALIHYYNSYCK